MNRRSRDIVQVAAASSSKRLKISSDDIRKSEIDYNNHLNHNIQMSLKRLQTKSDIVPDSRASLFSLLLSKGKAFHFPNAVLPKQLRRKRIATNTEVALGKHGGLCLKKELGQGAYGRVILMDDTESSQRNKIAVKVQTPTGCLSWEYTVLQRLEQRLIQDGKEDTNYDFPRPISFISVADGGILSMSAASESGLNLVDLYNFYNLILGEPAVPELIALHYISIALAIIEKLHWYGRILVSISYVLLVVRKIVDLKSHPLFYLLALRCKTRQFRVVLLHMSQK